MASDRNATIKRSNKKMIILAFFNVRFNIALLEFCSVASTIRLLIIESLREGSGVYQALQPQLLAPKLLLHSTLLGVDGTELIEYPVVCGAKGYGKD
jgi:hypothetical protein